MNASAQPTLSQARPGTLARQLGYAGLIPFVAGALVIWLLSARSDLREPLFFAVHGLSSYAALIVAFLGGLPWGMSMRPATATTADQSAATAESPLTRRALWQGIAYALGAWVGVCMPPESGLVVLGSLLIGCYLSDRKLYPALGVAPWLQLRFRLTVVASLSCFLAAAQI